MSTESEQRKGRPGENQAGHHLSWGIWRFDNSSCAIVIQLINGKLTFPREIIFVLLSSITSPVPVTFSLTLEASVVTLRLFVAATTNPRPLKLVKGARNTSICSLVMRLQLSWIQLITGGQTVPTRKEEKDQSPVTEELHHSWDPVGNCPLRSRKYAKVRSTTAGGDSRWEETDRWGQEPQAHSAWGLPYGA